LSSRPDAILGFYTPVLWLIAPAHAPVFALGNGATLPPVLGASFPRLSPDSTPLADERVMLANANAVLAKFGRPALSAISDVLGGCASLLYGVPAFDPYLQIRRELSKGLLAEQPSPSILPAKQRLAAFLDVYCPGIEAIVLALAGFTETPIDVHVAGATKGMRRFLEQQPHVKVWNEYAALLDHIGNVSAVVHHGAQDVAERCMSRGRPHLLLPWTREQVLFETYTRWMGFSWTKDSKVPVETMVGTFRGLLKNTALAVAAQHHAQQLAGTNLPDALPGIIQQIEQARPN
jgi:hypothetical protein